MALQRIQVQVTDEQYAWLKKQAYKLGKSMAEIVRDVVEAARKEK